MTYKHKHTYTAHKIHIKYLINCMYTQFREDKVRNRKTKELDKDKGCTEQ